MRSVLTRGTVVIDVEACKGCDLCIDACPPGCAGDDDDRGQHAAATATRCCCPGCTGCKACSQICPDFVFQVYKYDTPIEIEVEA